MEQQQHQQNCKKHDSDQNYNKTTAKTATRTKANPAVKQTQQKLQKGEQQQEQ